MAARVSSGVRVVGRYALHDEIAAGGMATVHLGRLLGQAGFSRTVAIKRLHAQFAKDPDFVAMFMDEARLAARIHHPNVVATLDVVAREGELFLVMEYIPGESLSKLLRFTSHANERVDPRIAASMVAGFLHGLHAAHEARNERGEPLELVHRDISPQNILVGVDGIARVVDFGIAKAVGRVHTTREGQLKGKLSYMAPEQIHGVQVSRRTDVYAASIVLWELLTGRRLFARENEAAVMMAALTTDPPPPSTLAPGIPGALDRITLRGLARTPDARFRTARDMALELEGSLDLALPSEIGAWVQATAGSMLMMRASRVAEIESTGGDIQTRSSAPPVEPHDNRTLMAASSNTPAAASRSKVGMTLALLLAVGGLLFALRSFTAPPAVVRPGAVNDGTGHSSTAEAPAESDPPRGGVPTYALEALPAAPPSASANAEPERAAAQVTPAPPPPPRAPVVTPPHHAPPSGPGATTTSKCDPPYRVDASGRKIFKLECL